MTDDKFENWVFEHGIQPQTGKLSAWFAIMTRSVECRVARATLPAAIPVVKWAAWSSFGGNVTFYSLLAFQRLMEGLRLPEYFDLSPRSGFEAECPDHSSGKY